jgi:hypothetical protein
MVRTTQAGTTSMLTRTIPQRLHSIIHIQEVLFTTRILELNSITQHTLEVLLEQQTLEMLEQLERLELMESRADL